MSEFLNRTVRVNLWIVLPFMAFVFAIGIALSARKFQKGIPPKEIPLEEEKKRCGLTIATSSLFEKPRNAYLLSGTGMARPSDGLKIWLLVSSFDRRKFWPQREVILTDSIGWNSEATLGEGGSEDQSMLVLLALAQPCAHRFLEYATKVHDVNRPGKQLPLSELPPGSVEAAHKEVIKQKKV